LLLFYCYLTTVKTGVIEEHAPGEHFNVLKQKMTLDDDGDDEGWKELGFWKCF